MPENENMCSRTLKSQWFAIQTVAKHEKSVTKHLQEKDVDTFLPLLPETHRWSDRRTKVDVPLFSCYTFVRISPAPEKRLPVLTTPGVLGFVGRQRQGTAIPDSDIDHLMTALKNGDHCIPHPFLRAGRRVRIRGGSLAGIEGILVREGADQSVVVSVHLLQRSVAIKIRGYELEFL
jgi:transcription antitermination factor NusG